MGATLPPAEPLAALTSLDELSPVGRGVAAYLVGVAIATALWHPSRDRGEVEAEVFAVARPLLGRVEAVEAGLIADMLLATIAGAPGMGRRA